MSNFQLNKANKVVLKSKILLSKKILTINDKCVKICYTMQIYLKKSK